MAHESDSVSHQMQLSLNDLSMELQSLGLKSSFRNCSNNAELCESLLSTAWTLINSLHCSALGLNQSQNAVDREALLLSEKQSLESKLCHLKSEVNLKEIALAKEREIVRRIEGDLMKHNDTIQTQKQSISQLTNKMKNQAKDLRQKIRKQEAQNESLREIVRKSLGIGLRTHPVNAEKLCGAFGTLAVTNELAEQIEIQQSSVNRMQHVNQTLVGENLMLRDALQMLHSDVSNILDTARKMLSLGGASGSCDMPPSIFRLPLSYCMKKIQTLRQDQIYKLHVCLQSLVNKPGDALS